MHTRRHQAQAEIYGHNYRVPQQSMAPGTPYAISHERGLEQEAGYLLGTPPLCQEPSPSKQELWLKNPNSYTSLHLEPQQDVQVRCVVPQPFWTHPSAFQPEAARRLFS